MAARENQGYLIAVIILVLLTLVLALAAFLGLSRASENSDSNQDLENELMFNKKLVEAYYGETEVLKAIIGENGPSIAEIPTQMDVLKGTAATKGLEPTQRQQLQDIVDQTSKIKEAYEKEMAGSVPVVEGEDGEQVAQSTPTLIAKIRTLTDLVAKKVGDYNIQVQASRQAEQTASQKIAEMTNTVKLNQAELAKNRDELAAEKKRSLTKENELTSKLEQAQSENEDSKKAFQTAQQEAANTIRAKENEIALVQVENEKLKVRINRYEAEVYDHPDGQIVKVASRLRTVYIDLGSADGLTNNRTFSVYDQSVTNFEKDNYKAMIEVIRVSPYRAEARITQEDPVNPILAGDHVLTATWDPGFRVPFALAGVFDLDHDIYDDTEKLIQLIERNGGSVVVRHDKEGNIEGEMDANVRYLVVGKGPISGEDASRPQAAQGIVSAMEKMREQAEQNTVQVIDLQKLLNRMGVRPTPKTERTKRGSFERNPSDTLKDADK